MPNSSHKKDQTPSKPDNADPKINTVSQTQETPPHNKNAKKILAIDDMKTLRDLLSRTLKAGGHTVMEAVDGVDGLNKFDEFKPDLVISDLNMPNLDGIGFVKGARERAHGQSIPILILTTETNEALKLKAREAGATGWLTKPFNPERILKLVHQLTQ